MTAIAGDFLHVVPYRLHNFLLFKFGSPSRFMGFADIMLATLLRSVLTEWNRTRKHCFFVCYADVSNLPDAEGNILPRCFIDVLGTWL